MTIPTFYCPGCYHSRGRVYANLHIARETIQVCGYPCMTNALRAHKIIVDTPAIALTNSVWVEIVGSKTPTPPRLNVIEEELSPLRRSPKMQNVNDHFDNDLEQLQKFSKENKNE